MSDVRTTIKDQSKSFSLVGLWDVVNQVELTEPEGLPTSHLVLA